MGTCRPITPTNRDDCTGRRVKSLAPNLSAQSPFSTPSLWSSLCSEPWAGRLPVMSGARGLDSLLVLRQSEMTAIRGETSA